MIEFQTWCKTCERETGFEVVDGLVRCEVCKGPHVGANTESESGNAKSCLKIFLVVVAIGFVVLAFVFAACVSAFRINQ
jgi:hypothetical protein